VQRILRTALALGQAVGHDRARRVRKARSPTRARSGPSTGGKRAGGHRHRRVARHHAKVVEFADRVAAIGCTAVLPHLFGEPGRDPQTGSTRHRGVHRPVVLAHLHRSRVHRAGNRQLVASRRLVAGARRRRARAVRWPRGRSSRHVFHRRLRAGDGSRRPCAGPVLSQPSLPLGVTAGRRRTIDISPDELAVVKGRCQRDGLRVVGLRSRAIAFYHRSASSSSATSSATPSSPSSDRPTRPTRRRRCRRTRCSPST